jgi:hypothetical protein
MNSVEVHIHVTYTVIDAMWLTTDVNLDVISIKMDTARNTLVKDVIDEHRTYQRTKNRALYNTRGYGKSSLRLETLTTIAVIRHNQTDRTSCKAEVAP